MFEFEIIDFQALNRIGLRVVLDVVYNHLQGSGPFGENSVLDKVTVDLSFVYCFSIPTEVHNF